MDEIKYLLKFGKYPHIREFAEGSLYCSDAVTFWGIEEDLKIKGQGDILEAGTRVFAQRMALTKNGANSTTTIRKDINGLIHYDSAKHIPVFCMFAVGKNDCSFDKLGNPLINLSEDVKKTIKNHFPNADSVGIIKDPDSFIHDVENTIGYEVKHDKVHYFHIDMGFPANDGINTANDLEYAKYLMQDTPPINGYYFLIPEYIYRVLFCKDVFFKNEHEYRIVLPSETITCSKRYPIHIRQTIKIIPLDVFLK